MAQHQYYPNGTIKSDLVHVLRDGECPCRWENRPMHYTDGKYVYKKRII